jgi:hypothetical protein
MLGGMSGGGMGFIFAPERKAEAQERLQAIMSATKRELQHALPFAMEPVVYDFAINENGTFADLLTEGDALMPRGYYTLIVPDLLRQELRSLSPLRRTELDIFGAACRTKPELRGMVQTLFDAMLPRGKSESKDAQNLGACSRRMASMPSNTSRSARILGRAASASHKIGCPRMPSSKTCARRMSPSLRAAMHLHGRPAWPRSRVARSP